MTQVDILKSTDEPLSEQKVSELQASINAINDEMAKIDEFYTVNRDSYLKIIDTNSVNEMGKNNANATQSLKTMLDDVKKLNSNIVKSIDLFRSALGLHSRDYDLYMVFPPETIDAIDTSLPTDKNSSDEMKDELAKKKQELTVSLNNATNGIASLYNKLKQQKRTKDLTNIDFSGLSSAIKNAKSLTLADTKEPEKDASLEPVVIVENIDIAPLEEKTTEETEIIVASNENLTEYLPVVENNISTPALDNNENNDSDKVLENKSLTKSIISKTKEALANLMSSITKKEKEITNNILPTKVEITEDIKDIAINDTNIDAKNLPEVETNEITNTHKVNPVIAMDLDKKEEANDIELALSNVKNTKTGFTTTESTKEINVAQNKNIIAKQEEKVDSKKEFIKLFANTNDNFVKTVNVETPKIITQDIVDEDVSNSKKYVFATSSLDGKFSGNIGKKILKNKSNTLSNEINKKYVFNKSSVKEAKFNGEIGKIFAVSAN